MRFQLNLKVTSIGGEGLPINYQTLVSNWLFNIIRTNDPEATTWLQSKGLNGKGKIMMLTLSRLFFDEPSIEGDRLKFESSRIKLLMGLHIVGTQQQHILDLFLGQKGEISDRRGGIRFEVENIYRHYDIEIEPEMEFRTISPIFITMKNPIGGNTDHIAPDHAEFKNLIFENLCHKYNSFLGEERAHIDFKPSDFTFHVTTPPVARLVTLYAKDGTISKLKAFDCEFTMSIPKPLMLLALNMGIGKSNSLGFGMIEKIEEPMEPRALEQDENDFEESEEPELDTPDDSDEIAE
jgi:CRISPR-associated endoribonuclease Cas6